MFSAPLTSVSIAVAIDSSTTPGVRAGVDHFDLDRGRSDLRVERDRQRDQRQPAGHQDHE